MKQHLEVIAMTLVSGTLLACLIMCGKDPSPPGPTPPNPHDVEFSLAGKTIEMDGVLKASAKVSVEEVKRSLKISMDLIDSAK